MAENLFIHPSANKIEKYQSLLPQLKALIEGETDWLANLSNLMAGLYFGMDFFWIGVYFVKGNELVLGPFQGPIACTRIAKGKGVCGSAWQKAQTIVVPDVEKFPGHIACSSETKSEIVLPAFKNKKVFLVLDVDSKSLNNFDQTDEKFLQEVVEMIEKLEIPLFV